MRESKTQNEIINDKIQEIAIKLYDKTITERQRNELAALVYPKLKYYIWSICKNEEDTCEALQFSFKKIFKNIDRFNPKKARFTTWIYRIARNETLYYLYRKGINPVMPVDTIYENIGQRKTSQYEGCEHEVNELYELTIAEIYKIEDPTLKGIAVDKMIKNDRVKTIAARYDINENTIKTKLRKIRSDIKKNVMACNPNLRESLNHIFKI